MKFGENFIQGTQFKLILCYLEKQAKENQHAEFLLFGTSGEISCDAFSRCFLKIFSF